MNTPLVLFYNILPIEVINIIQSFIVNEISKKVLEYIFHKINIKQQIYDRFVYFNYIIPNCYCFAIHINDNCCNWCFDYKYTNKYNLPLFNTIFYRNSQYKKIMFDEDF